MLILKAFHNRLIYFFHLSIPTTWINCYLNHLMPSIYHPYPHLSILMVELNGEDQNTSPLTRHTPPTTNARKPLSTACINPGRPFSISLKLSRNTQPKQAMMNRTSTISASLGIAFALSSSAIASNYFQPNTCTNQAITSTLLPHHHGNPHHDSHGHHCGH